MKHTCRWVLLAAGVGSPAEYCAEKVSFKLVKDDDGNKVRKYNTFCPRHQTLADAEDAEEESK